MRGEPLEGFGLRVTYSGVLKDHSSCLLQVDFGEVQEQKSGKLFRKVLQSSK